jgi:hypothetical protein
MAKGDKEALRLFTCTWVSQCIDTMKRHGHSKDRIAYIDEQLLLSIPPLFNMRLLGLFHPIPRVRLHLYTSLSVFSNNLDTRDRQSGSSESRGELLKTDQKPVVC